LNYKNNIVKKPWGYEYLVYGNEHVGLWFLYIKHNHSTSMHCHPNKTTGLILLDGEATVSFLSNSVDISPKEKLMIRKGLFHSTTAKSTQGICLLEIETPRDKHNLVRLEDKYGRQGKPYEDSSFETPKESECFWVEAPPDGEERIYNFANSKIKILNISTIEDLENIQDNTNVIFLQGGILTDYDVAVSGPGDIVVGSVIKKLTKVFKKMSKETIVMIVEDLNE